MTEGEGISDASKSPTEQASTGSAYTRDAVGYTFLHGLNFQVSTNQPIAVQGSSFQGRTVEEDKMEVAEPSHKAL